MIIRYSNGYQIEGVLLSRTEDSMRLAVQGSDDVLQLNRLHGTWVSEDCEPVEVDPLFASRGPDPVVTMDDCVCSKELASKLLRLLFSGEEGADAEAAALAGPSSAPVYQQVV